MLFVPDIAMPQDDPRSDLLPTKLMDRMWLGRGRPKGFAIDGQVGVIGLSLWGTQPAGFCSTESSPWHGVVFLCYQENASFSPPSSELEGPEAQERERQ